LIYVPCSEKRRRSYRPIGVTGGIARAVVTEERFESAQFHQEEAPPCLPLRGNRKGAEKIFDLLKKREKRVKKNS
jgi:hypothetical protein